MKRMLWIAFAVLMLLTGCTSAPAAMPTLPPEATIEPTENSDNEVIETATLNIMITCGTETVKGEITANGVKGQYFVFSADDIEAAALKITLLDGYALINSEARDITIAYGETKSMAFIADKTTSIDFDYLSIRDIHSGNVISLGSAQEDINSVAGDPIEKYGNTYLYNGGLFVEYDSNDVADEFSLFSHESTTCAWELNSGIVAGKSSIDNVLEAYGKDSGYWLNGDLFYMLCDDGSTESVSDYVVMYGFSPVNNIAKVIVMTRHVPDSSVQESKPTSAPKQTDSPSPDQTARPTAQPTSDQTAPTAGMKNALSSAKRYISILSFSHEGLIKQLKYEGYTDDEAKYGADNCGADWMEQAEKKAKEYIDVMAFSYKGLIKQLKYEGFTEEQATHGADLCGADWIEQAKIKAADYLGIMSFSRSGLIEQLKYEGFTQEQAEYGAAENGLS